MSQSQHVDQVRRSLLGAAAVSIAAGPAAAQTGVQPTANTTFGPLRRVDAGVLNIAYAELGPAGGPPIILLHGWPYDIHSYAEVAPLLAARGYRVIVPHLRGFGATRFLSDDAIRNGQQSALGLDVIALMDALKIERAVLGGFDWGARTVDIVAALLPGERIGRVAVPEGTSCPA